MTWKEIKDAALQLMYSYSTQGTANSTTSNHIADYLLSMVAPANVAIRDLAGVCPVRRRLVIKHYDEDNIVSTDDSSMYVDEDGKGTSSQVVLLQAESAKSFYCEVDGTAIINFEYIEEDDSVIVLETQSVSYTSMTPVKYIFGQGTDVQVRITGNARVQNYAFYARDYVSTAYIPSPAEWQTYSISELIEAQDELDFYKFDERPVRLGNQDITGYARFNGIDSISLDRNIADGEIFVHYIARPTVITSSTSDSFELELPEEACDLIPYYIASVVFLEDDPIQKKMCPIYRDEYYTRRATIAHPADVLGADQFISSSGW